MSGRIKILFGTYPLASWPAETTKEFLEILDSYKVKDLDTAFAYADSEKVLGEIGAPTKYSIHTKAPGFRPGCLKRDSILSGAQKSFEDLRVESVETYFLHSPDHDTPIEETVDTINELFTAGKFKRFGLSNFQPEDVQKIHDYASSKGYVLPTVYQGNYNPVGRHSEKTIFPLLRKLKISFYAYSPIAGGFLVKSPEEIISGKGRFDKSSALGPAYQRLYNKPLLLTALTEWDNISKEAGISKAALANRWTAYNSNLNPESGDGIILGASRPAQLKETLESLTKGPLEQWIVDRIEEVWNAARDEAPLDNFNG